MTSSSCPVFSERLSIAPLYEIVLGYVVVEIRKGMNAMGSLLVNLPPEIQMRLGDLCGATPDRLGYWAVWVNVRALISLIPQEYLPSAAGLAILNYRKSFADIIAQECLRKRYETSRKVSPSSGPMHLRQNESGSKVVERAVRVHDWTRAKEYHRNFRWLGSTHLLLDRLMGVVRRGDSGAFEGLIDKLEKRPKIYASICRNFPRLVSKAIASGDPLILSCIRRRFGTLYEDVDTLSIALKRGNTHLLQDLLSENSKIHIPYDALPTAVRRGHFNTLNLFLSALDTLACEGRLVETGDMESPTMAAYVIVLKTAAIFGYEHMLRCWWRDEYVCTELIRTLAYHWNPQWLTRALRVHVSDKEQHNSCESDSWLAAHLAPFTDLPLQEHLQNIKGSSFVTILKRHRLLAGISRDRLYD